MEPAELVASPAVAHLGGKIVVPGGLRMPQHRRAAACSATCSSTRGWRASWALKSRERRRGRRTTACFR
eukprot:6244268-Alexandrium_andersonii.AAC.1